MLICARYVFGPSAKVKEMASAKEIADERLAKGDISLEEHARIIDIISPASPSQQIPTAQPKSTKTTKSNWSGLKSLLSLVFFVFLVLYFYNQFKKSGAGTFNIGQLQTTGAGGVISFTIANPNDRSDDVVMYITQENRRMCEHVAFFEKNKSYNIRFSCSSMLLGDFRVVASWASYIPEVANAAKRL